MLSSQKELIERERGTSGLSFQCAQLWPGSSAPPQPSTLTRWYSFPFGEAQESRVVSRGSNFESGSRTPASSGTEVPCAFSIIASRYREF